MRRMMTLLAEIQKERIRQQYTKLGRPVPSKELQEVDLAYRYLDQNLSDVWSGVTGPRKFQEALTSADFPNALGEFVQRRMVPAYEQREFMFEPLVMMDSTPNFLQVTRYQRRAEFDDLEFLPPTSTPRPGDVPDATKRQYQVHDWAKTFDIDRHAIVNDDLGYFDDITRQMGRAARRTLEKFVSRMLTNAVTTAALVSAGALFSTTGRFNTARLSEAELAMAQRIDDKGEPIRAALKYLIHPIPLRNTIRTIQASQLIPENDATTGATNAANIFRNDFTPIEDPYMASAPPDIPWYALTDWRVNNVIPFVLARLQGMRQPVITRQMADHEIVSSLTGGGRAVPASLGDYFTGKLSLTVWDIWGTYIDGTDGNLFDIRGAYYSSGTVA